jgi:hypothetical protein
MTRDTVSRICAWFAEHDGDGDFLRQPRDCPYFITAPGPETRWVLYSTKRWSAAYALETSGGSSIQLVARGGLPNEGDPAWIRVIAGDRPILFLGDNDPVDLLVFVWLRCQIPVSYLGVSDRLIRKLGVRLTNSLLIPLSDAEKAAMPLLAEVCPEYRKLIGSRCMGMLEAGKKIEVEAVVNFASGQTTMKDAIAR